MSGQKVATNNIFALPIIGTAFTMKNNTAKKGDSCIKIIILKIFILLNPFFFYSMYGLHLLAIKCIYTH